MFSLRSVYGNEKGIVLPVALVLLTLLTAMGGAAVVITKTDLKIGGNYRSSKRAFYIAEAGVNRGWNELVDGDGTDDFLDVYNNGPKPLFSSEPLGDGSYTVTAEGVAGSDPNLVKVTSVACLPAGCASGSAKSTIEAVFRRNASLFQFALLAKETIMLSGGAITDSFDSRVADYVAGTAGSEGHIGSNGDIIATGSPKPSIVNGNASAGNSIEVTGKSKIIGDATAGGNINVYGPEAIEGIPTPNANPAPSYNFSPVNSPCGSSYSDGSGINGGVYNDVQGSLLGNPANPIILDPGRYCFSHVDLKGGSTLTVNGPVTIYVTEHSDFSGGSLVNTTRIAANLRIFSSVDAGVISDPRDDAPGIEVSGGGTAYISIYAPDAKVEFSGSSEFFGSVVAKVIDNNGGSKIHYDKALEDDPSAEIKMASWREVF